MRHGLSMGHNKQVGDTVPTRWLRHYTAVVAVPSAPSPSEAGRVP